MAVINNLFLLAIPLHSQSSSHEINYIDPSVGALKCSSVSKDKLFFARNIQMQSSRESAVDDLKKHICTISGFLSLLHQWLFELFYVCIYLPKSHQQVALILKVEIVATSFLFTVL